MALQQSDDWVPIFAAKKKQTKKKKFKVNECNQSRLNRLRTKR